MAFVQNDDFIQRFPRQKNWNGLGDLYQYEGFWYRKPFLEGVIEAQNNFNAKSTDIFVASHLKTGTTWLKALTFAIATRSTFPDLSATPLLFKIPHDCIPFLEIDLLSDHSTIRDAQNPLISTHIPFNSLPKSIMGSGCKIVYIWRDAKDVFVSLMHFLQGIRRSKNIVQPPFSTEEAFEQFCLGVSNYGPYWEHVLGYWKAKLEFAENILFIKYEDMRKDTRLYVMKLAEFIGYPFSVDEEDNGIVENIIHICSFENLSNLEVNKSGVHRANTPGAMNNNLYFRKGEIGDWKNELTVEMGARLDSLMKQKLNGSGLLEDIASSSQSM